MLNSCSSRSAQTKSRSTDHHGGTVVWPRPICHLWWASWPWESPWCWAARMCLPPTPRLSPRRRLCLLARWWIGVSLGAYLAFSRAWVCCCLGFSSWQMTPLIHNKTCLLLLLMSISVVAICYYCFMINFYLISELITLKRFHSTNLIILVQLQTQSIVHAWNIKETLTIFSITKLQTIFLSSIFSSNQGWKVTLGKVEAS